MRLFKRFWRHFALFSSTATSYVTRTALLRFLASNAKVHPSGRQSFFQAFFMGKYKKKKKTATFVF